MKKLTLQLPRQTPRAPLTTDRRTGGRHKSRRNQLPRKAKHKGRQEEL